MMTSVRRSLPFAIVVLGACASEDNESRSASAVDSGTDASTEADGSDGSAGDGAAGLGGGPSDDAAGSAGADGAVLDGGSVLANACPAAIRDGCWKLESVGSATGCAVHSMSIAAGVTHIGYACAASSFHVMGSSGGWVTEQLPANAQSLTAESGSLHACSFASPCAPVLGNVHAKAGSWSTTTASLNPIHPCVTAYNCQVGVDGLGQPHALFDYDDGVSNGKVEYVSPGATTGIKIGIQGDVPSGISATTLTSGVLHVAMGSHIGPPGLSYATNESGTWQTEVVVETEGQYNPALALLGSSPRIVFGGFELVDFALERRLRYAVRSAPDTWLVYAASCAGPGAERPASRALTHANDFIYASTPFDQQTGIYLNVITGFSRSGEIIDSSAKGVSTTGGLGGDAGAVGIEIDSGGYVHVAYVDAAGTLIHGTRCAPL